jgi:hypothetical protein
MRHDSRTSDIHNRRGNSRAALPPEEEVQLPAGMSLGDWFIEQGRQNLRIRALLGCIRLLGGVLESNYSLLHCSPERLREIWRKVRQVSELIRTEIAPLLAAPSKSPELEAARQRTQMTLEMLNKTVLADLDRFPDAVPAHRLIEVRKFLCVSIGKIYAFLQDAFGEIMAHDPRSSHDADYYLSKRFPQDLEEAEWLYATVQRLRSHLQGLEEGRARQLTGLAAEIAEEETIPTGERWKEASAFLDLLLEDLSPKLKEVLALRGIRFYEMEILDRYAVEIPTQCRILEELHDSGRLAAEEIKEKKPQSRQEREQTVRDLLGFHAVLSRRMVELMNEIDNELRDLMAFIPIWLDSISMRRALLLKRTGSNGDGAAKS